MEYLFSGEISKFDEEKQIVFGWAYISHDNDGKQIIDKSGEFIPDPRELEDAAYTFVLKSRVGRDFHGKTLEKYDTSPIGEGKNWVTSVGGLPLYVRAVAHALIRGGHSESDAIQIAVGKMKAWAAGHSAWGEKGTPSAKTQAKAAAALAEWERKKAESHVKKSAPAQQATLVESTYFNLEKSRAMGIPDGILPQSGWWVGFKIHDPRLWDKYKSGERPSFSIHGNGFAKRVGSNNSE